MKKIIISLLAAVTLSVSSAYASIDDTFQSGAYVVVNGNIEKEKSGVFVTLVVAKQGVTEENIISDFDNSISYIDQTQTDENGGYSFRIYLPDSFDADSIYIRSGEGKYRTVSKENVSYTAVALVREAIENVNNAYYNNTDDSARVSAMLTALSSEYLMLDELSEYEEYSALTNPDAVAEYMLNSIKAEKLTYDSDEELSAAVDRVVDEWKLAVGISAVNESENQAEMKAVFTKYADIFNIDTTRLDSITTGEYFCEQMKRFAPETVEELAKAYNSSCAFSDVNNTISWSVMKEIFTADYEYLGVDMSASSDYAKISDKDSFFKQLSNNIPFSDLNELVTEFNALVTRFNQNSTTSTNTPSYSTGGSGGGGSSSGGSSSSGKSLSGSIAASTPTIITSDTNTAVTVKLFEDIDEAEWARESIEYLVGMNIVNGVDENRFEPQRNITRAEFLKMIILAFGIQSSSEEEAFNDISPDDWYYECAVTGKNSGIIMGDESGNFNPNMNISRQDMAVMLYRCMKDCGYTLQSGTNSFEDSDDIKDYAQ